LDCETDFGWHGGAPILTLAPLLIKNHGRIGYVSLPFPAQPVFGARAHDIADGVTPGELAAQAAEVGISRLQLALMKSYPKVAKAEQLNQGLGEQFRSALAEHGVTIAIFSCYLNLIHPDADKRHENLNTFKAYLRNAPAFGARLVVSETGSMLPGLGYTLDNFTEPAYRTIVEAVKELCYEASHYGVLVGIEPGLNHPIYNLETTKALIDDVGSPDLRIVLDPFNLLQTEAAGGSPETDPANYLKLLEKAFDLFGDKIEVIQLKDFVIDQTGTTPNGVRDVPIGTGLLPGKEVVELIWNRKPGIDIIFEGTPKAQIPAAISSLIG